MFTFHIGLHKTGTSTLQTLMAANIETLAARGIVYPTLGRRRFLAHHVLSTALRESGGISDPHWEQLRALRNIAREKTVVLSSEGFTVSSIDPQLVRQGIEGDEARVIVYLRNLPSWAVSAYSQRAKMGSQTRTFDEFIAVLSRMRHNFADLILPWARVFGPDHLRIRSIESDILLNGQIIDDFLSALGTTRDGLAIPPNANETPDWRVVELLKEYHMRRQAETGETWTRADQEAQQTYKAGLAAGARLGWNQRVEYLTREQQQRLIERYRSDRERLLAAIPDCRIADITLDQTNERPFMPSPEAVSVADRRAFEAAFEEALARMPAPRAKNGERPRLGRQVQAPRSAEERRAARERRLAR